MTTTEHTHSPETAFGTDVAHSLRRPAAALRRQIPDTYQGFTQLHDSAMADGVLSRKTKELLALGIAVAQQCDGCIASHARGAAVHGATEEEVAETIGVCILMMGGPGTVYGPRAFAAFQDFAAKRAAT